VSLTENLTLFFSGGKGATAFGMSAPGYAGSRQAPTLPGSAGQRPGPGMQLNYGAGLLKAQSAPGAPPGFGAAAGRNPVVAAKSTAPLNAPPGLQSAGLFSTAMQSRTVEREDGGGGGSSAAAGPPAVPADAYGMAGLLGILKAVDRDIPALALGTDLSAPGVPLSPSGGLPPHPTHALFPSPWAKEPAPREPHYAMPASYRMPQPALKTGHLAKFDVTTLLYIFYAMPRDVLQAYAAQELYAREWRYHRDLKLWFKAEAAPGKPPGFVYFDVGSWAKVPYTGSVASLQAGFLTGAEVPTSA
jgi:CCR4-NOT transcription complex subunit 2